MQRGPSHQAEFYARVEVEDEVSQGEWERTRKLAEASAAAACLGRLGLEIDEQPQRGVYESAPGPGKQNLLLAHETNGWELPEFDCSLEEESVDGEAAVHRCTVTLTDGPLAGRVFSGAGRRRTAAESVAASHAVVALRDVVGCNPEVEGGLHELRQAATREGLLLRVRGTSVCIGGKAAVKRLRAAGAGPDRIGTSDVWSGLELRVLGRGLRRRECRDDAARSVVQALSTDAWEGWRPPEAAECEEYFATQTITASDRPEACDAWVDEHVLKPSPEHVLPPQRPGAVSAGGAAEGARSGVVVALDCEWVPGEDRVSVVQLATASHCLVASITAGLPPRLRQALLDRGVSKVGKGLSEDWRRLAPVLLPDSHPADGAGGVGGAGGAVHFGEHGWHDLADFLPYHLEPSMDALSRMMLRRGYSLKGTVDHGRWSKWPLPSEQLNYAAMDACVIYDVLQAIAAREVAESDAAAMS